MESKKDWIQEELGDVRFGDQRLEKRLRHVVRQVAKQPTHSLPQALGDWGDVKAAYRLFGHEKVDPAEVLRAHGEAGWRRAAHWAQGDAVVLAVQDTTVLDYSRYRSVEGLGPIGSEQQKTRGMLAHHGMLFGEEGVPFGLVWHHDWVRGEVRRKEDAAARRKRPWHEKESYRWGEALTAIEAAARAHQVRVVHVGDREADIFALFVRAEQVQAHLLVRAAQNRRVADDEVQKLWDAAREGEVAGRYRVLQWASSGGESREAEVEVRYRPVTVRPPAHLASQHKPVTLWTVEVREIAPPEGAEPVHWLLLSNQAISGAAEALRRVAWYKVRWGIEVYHRILKSGCRVEARRLKDVARLRRMLAVYRVVAWHGFWMTHMARQRGEEPCTWILPAEACAALRAYLASQGKKGRKKRKAPQRRGSEASEQDAASELTVAEALRAVARLGGHLGRRGDGPPGPTVLWRGLMRLWDMTTMYVALRSPPP